MGTIAVRCDTIRYDATCAKEETQLL